MPDRAPLRPATWLAVGLLVLVGCSSTSELPPLPVDVAKEPALTAAQQLSCRSLLAALPDEVDPGVRRREVVPASGRAAAWGEPAVILRCGTEPGDPDENPLGVNGVDWSVRDIGGSFRWTTLRRSVDVAVDVPDAYANSAELVNPLASALRDAVPVASPLLTPAAAP